MDISCAASDGFQKILSTRKRYGQTIRGPNLFFKWSTCSLTVYVYPYLLRVNKTFKIMGILKICRTTILLYPGYTGVRELLQRRYRKIRGETPPGIFNLVYMPHCCRACSIFHQNKSRMNSKVCTYLILIQMWCIAIAHTMKIEFTTIFYSKNVCQWSR